MTLTIKLDRNWSSFQLANSTPPLSVTDSAIAPSARIRTLALWHLSSRLRHRPSQAPCHLPLACTVPQQPDPNSTPSRRHRRSMPRVALSIIHAKRCVRGHRRGGQSHLPPHMQAWVLLVLPVLVGVVTPLKNTGSHIDASHSRQPLVKGERLVRYEMNAVMHLSS